MGAVPVEGRHYGDHAHAGHVPALDGASHGHDALWANALAYTDDVFVFSRTFDEHMMHAECVFTRLAGAGVVLKPSEWHFAQLQVRFLSHIVQGGGRDVDPAKVEAVNRLRPPRNAAEVRSYLQMAS